MINTSSKINLSKNRMGGRGVNLNLNTLITTNFKKFKAPKSYIRLSDELAGKKIKVPKFVAKFVNKLAKKEFIPPTGIILKSGGTLSKSLAGVSSAVSLGLGIWDTIKGANKMKAGSSLSKEFRKVIEPLKKAKIDINKAYNLMN